MHMRALLLIILGLAIGAVAATMIGNVLRMRNAYPRAVMVIMQHHMARLREAMEHGQCPADMARLHLERVAAVDTEIVPAFAGPNGSILKPFRRYAEQLQGAVHTALQQAPAGCGALTAAVRRISDRCSDCHRQYR